MTRLCADNVGVSALCLYLLLHALACVVRQSPQSLQQLRSQGATIVDVRAEHEYKNQRHGHVVGAVNWPLASLSQRLSSGAVDRKAVYVTYCKGMSTRPIPSLPNILHLLHLPDLCPPLSKSPQHFSSSRCNVSSSSPRPAIVSTTATAPCDACRACSWLPLHGRLVHDASSWPQRHRRRRRLRRHGAGAARVWPCRGVADTVILFARMHSVTCTLRPSWQYPTAATRRRRRARSRPSRRGSRAARCPRHRRAPSCCRR